MTSAAARSARAVYNRDREFMESEKEHGRYYIGQYRVVGGGCRNRIDFQLAIAVSPGVFLDTPVADVRRYLRRYAEWGYSSSGPVEILKMQIDEFPILDCAWSGTYKLYCVLVKTHWLRIVQRRWRAVLRARAAERARWGGQRYQRYREVHGRYPAPEGAHLALRGMLADLAR